MPAPKRALPAGPGPVAMPDPFNSTPGRAAVPDTVHVITDVPEAEHEPGTMERQLANSLAQIRTSNPHAPFLRSAALALARAGDQLDPSDTTGMLRTFSGIQKLLKDLAPENGDGSPADQVGPFGRMEPELVAPSEILDPCRPRFASRRRHERPTWGPFWGRCAKALGKPFMPWQQLAADLAGEVDHTGHLCYRTVFVTVPRQSGKTTLLLSVVLGRAMAHEHFGGRQNMVYAAQTALLAREKMTREYQPEMKKVPALAGAVKYKIGAGQESMEWYDSGTVFGVTATKEESGHGPVLDWAALDEAFAQPDGRMMDAWEPAQITRPMAQIWIVSTMGPATARWFKGQLAAARIAAELDDGYGTCLVEYGADPARTDYGNPELWATCMPALGHTITVAAVMTMYRKALADPEQGINGFRRPYLNQEVDKLTPSILPAEHWSKMCQPDKVRYTRPVITVDVSYDRKSACIAIGALAEDGVPLVRVIEYQAGTSWVVERLCQLREEYDVAAWIADAAGGVKSLKAELEQELFEFYWTSAGEMAAACGLIYDGVVNEAFTHYGEPALELAVIGAEKRKLGDAWAWTRSASQDDAATDICTLVAVTCAYWGQIKFGDDVTDNYEGSFG